MHPQTNGMVERFNRDIRRLAENHHFNSSQELEITPHQYVCLYNQELPQSVLDSKTSLWSIKNWFKVKPELFKKNRLSSGM
ncbi:MAG: integrase core domain-containing protein [Arsenophonus sp. NEOnobi-MAG3]